MRAIAMMRTDAIRGAMRDSTIMINHPFDDARCLRDYDAPRCRFHRPFEVF